MTFREEKRMFEKLLSTICKWKIVLQVTLTFSMLLDQNDRLKWNWKSKSKSKEKTIMVSDSKTRLFYKVLLGSVSCLHIFYRPPTIHTFYGRESHDLMLLTARYYNFLFKTSGKLQFSRLGNNYPVNVVYSMSCWKLPVYYPLFF